MSQQKFLMTSLWYTCIHISVIMSHFQAWMKWKLLNERDCSLSLFTACGFPSIPSRTTIRFKWALLLYWNPTTTPFLPQKGSCLSVLQFHNVVTYTKASFPVISWLSYLLCHNSSSVARVRTTEWKSEKKN